jgi:hypothetical protein
MAGRRDNTKAGSRKSPVLAPRNKLRFGQKGPFGSVVDFQQAARTIDLRKSPPGS